MYQNAKSLSKIQNKPIKPIYMNREEPWSNPLNATSLENAFQSNSVQFSFDILDLFI